MNVVLFGAGLALLVVGAEALVRGAAGLASRCGVSQLVVGLTVVAMGTSAPETAVSVTAAAAGRAELALGNVLGSNIANILLVLGLAALIRPLTVAGPVVGRDVPLMIAVTCLFLALAADGRLSRLDGVALLAGLVVYTVYLLRSRDAGTAGAAVGTQPLALQVGEVVLGLALLLLGAIWLVRSAVAMAQSLGVPELVIGLTVVAVGTSAPEIATSIVAAMRGHRDLAIGNVVGSNIVNVLGVLGASAAAARGGIGVSPAAWQFDVPVCLAAALVCLPIAASGRVVSRREGGLLLAGYATYTTSLVLAALRHEPVRFPAAALPAFAAVATVLLAGLVLRAAVRRRHAR